MMSGVIRQIVRPVRLPDDLVPGGEGMRWPKPSRATVAPSVT